MQCPEDKVEVAVGPIQPGCEKRSIDPFQMLGQAIVDLPKDTKSWAEQRSHIFWLFYTSENPY
jgi:hypothetical protein